MKTETVIAQITLSTRIKQRDSINNVCSGLKPVTEGIRMKTKTGWNDQKWISVMHPLNEWRRDVKSPREIRGVVWDEEILLQMFNDMDLRFWICLITCSIFLLLFQREVRFFLNFSALTDPLFLVEHPSHQFHWSRKEQHIFIYLLNVVIPLGICAFPQLFVCLFIC